MKPHHILKSFNGSQTGLDFNTFAAGTVAALSDSLAAIAVRERWAKPVEADTLAGGPHPELQPEPDAPNVLVESTAEDAPNDPETRETKVAGPDETKPAKPLNKMSKAELVAYALEKHGLELVPDSMNVKQMLAAIEKAAKA